MPEEKEVNTVEETVEKEEVIDTPTEVKIDEPNNVEEAPAQEEKPFDGFYDAIEVGDRDDVQAKINDARMKFKEIHTSVMKRNRIVGIVFLVVMVAMAVLAYVFPGLVMYMFFGVIAFFVIVLILSKSLRGKMDVAVGDYLFAYGSHSDSFVYRHDDIKDVKMGFRNKPDEEVIRSLAFKEKVFHIGSRDVIKGTMAGINFETADVSIKTGEVKDRKTHKTVFVGKVITLSTTIEDEGRVLLYKKGCGDAEPDNLADVNEVNVANLSEDWKVYSSNDNYEKIFTKGVIDALNSLSVDEILNDIIVSFQKERIMVALSYADSLMVIPLENDFSIDGVEHYKSDIEKVVEFVKAIKSNKYIKK